MVHMDSINEELKSQSDFATTSSAHDINNIILYPFAHQVRSLLHFAAANFDASLARAYSAPIHLFTFNSHDIFHLSSQNSGRWTHTVVDVG